MPLAPLLPLPAQPASAIAAARSAPTLRMAFVPSVHAFRSGNLTKAIASGGAEQFAQAALTQAQIAARLSG
ncbi:MAG TPA: hypothetical protein VGM45_01515 [Gaiellaceae bacterium]